MAIVVSGRQEEGERRKEEREKEKEGRPRERCERRKETRRVGDGCDGDGQWLYTG